MIREISSKIVEDTVVQLMFSAHFNMNPDIEDAIVRAVASETAPNAVYALEQIAENYQIARKKRMAICQDSGMTLVCAEIGQDVHICGDFETAVQNGVRRAHKEGFLRTSVVEDPLFVRRNTKDGTPAIIRVRLVPGNQIKLTVIAKGFGSENCSQMRMFIPSDPIEEIEGFIVATVSAGAKACPPVVVGVGIGGTMDKACELAKMATIRDISIRHQNPDYAALEGKLLERINTMGIGPAGLGGRTTALAVNIETYATHIASIPVAVNMCCHATRHAVGII